MLSILIPVYNTKVSGLVGDLHAQCVEAGVDFEILCYDDASDEEYTRENSKLNGKPGVRYEQLAKNMGRAAIRNLLAAEATYPYLLFVDADSQVVSPDYINRYLGLLKPGCVIYGGRQYSQRPPDKKKILHWKYGVQRESMPVVRRRKKPFLSFMSNNFVAHKDVLREVPFDMRHRGYGYEDTLFAFRLKKHGYTVVHTDNPLLHTGLEDTDVFLSKTIQAIENLVWMYKRGEIETTRMIDYYRNLKRLFVLPLLTGFVAKRKKRIFENLYSANPDLRLLQMYKLYVFDMLYAKKGE